jgi:hypothetical protein
MSKLMRLVVLVAGLMSLASTAGATTWHNSGATAFTATGPSGTLSSTGVQLRCATTDATATSPAGSFVGLTYVAITGTASFTGCTISGIPGRVHCSFSLTLTTAAVNHVYSGLVDAVCGLFDVSNTQVCQIEGQTAATYRNPETGLAAQLTLATSTTLRTTNGGVGFNCPLGVNEPTHLTQKVFSIVSAGGGPTITRTA